MESVQNSGKKKKRIVSVDLIKGLAIILVVVGHALGAVTTNTVVPVPDSITLVHDWIYGFHMPAFFIVAGLFVERWSGRSVREAIGRKLYRLGAPYFVWGGTVCRF